MKLMTKMITGLLASSLLIGGCNLPGVNNANSESALSTSVASTVVALQTALAANVTPTTAVVEATATEQTLPTFTAAALPQPTAVNYAPTATTQPGYLVTDVQDITAPDNTVFKPGESFTKTWRLTNGGAATWTPDFSVVYVSGDKMGATTVTLGRSVAPNQTIDVSVNLVAPATNGTYKGNFMLQTNGGKSFGVGATGTSPFWVKIVVQQFFQVSNAVVTAAPTSFSGTCPGSILLTATITSSSAGTVTYYFVTSSGTTSAYTMTFIGAATQTSSAITYPVAGPNPLTVNVYIDSPNHQGFAPITIPVTCTP